MKNLIYVLVSSLAFLFAMRLPCSAQQFSVETNALDWANYITINAEGGIAVGRHISLHGGVRINPWVFAPGDPEIRFTDPMATEERQAQNKKQAYNLGVRYWPWYIFSGFWFSAKGQYMEYDHGNVYGKREREAGDAWGVGLGAGYTYMLHENWNIDIGLGAWAGLTNYGRYRCTNCGQPVESGKKGFFLPDFFSVSLMYIF